MRDAQPLSDGISNRLAKGASDVVASVLTAAVGSWDWLLLVAVGGRVGLVVATAIVAIGRGTTRHSIHSSLEAIADGVTDGTCNLLSHALSGGSPGLIELIGLARRSDHLVDTLPTMVDASPGDTEDVICRKEKGQCQCPQEQALVVNAALTHQSS